MKIGIDLNGIVRDIFSKSAQIYEKNYMIENSNEKISEYNEKSDEWVENNENESFKYELNLPVDSLELINHFKFPTQENLYDFFYVDFPMQIFGHSSTFSANTFNILNDIYYNFRDNHEISIISDEMGKSKPATLFFLSKYGSLFEEIKFYSNITIQKLLNHYDIIITANPFLIEQNNVNCNIIKFETEYNKKVESNFTIKSILDIESTLNKLIK